MDDVTEDSGVLGEAVACLNHFKDLPDHRQRCKVMYPFAVVRNANESQGIPGVAKSSTTDAHASESQKPDPSENLRPTTVWLY